MGVAVANSVAVFPSHIIGLVTVGAVGFGFTVTKPDAIALIHPSSFVIVTLYVPALVDVKVFTLPGAVTPVGTVHV